MKHYFLVALISIAAVILHPIWCQSSYHLLQPDIPVTIDLHKGDYIYFKISSGDYDNVTLYTFDIQFSSCLGHIDLFYSFSTCERIDQPCADLYPNETHHMKSLVNEMIRRDGQFSLFASDMCDGNCALISSRQLQHDRRDINNGSGTNLNYAHFFGVRSSSSSSSYSQVQVWMKLYPSLIMSTKSSLDNSYRIIRNTVLNQRGSRISGVALDWTTPRYCLLKEKNEKRCLEEVSLTSVQYHVYYLSPNNTYIPFSSNSTSLNMLTECGIRWVNATLLALVNRTHLDDLKHLGKGSMVNVVGIAANPNIFPIVYPAILISENSSMKGFLIASCIAIGMALLVIFLVVTISFCFRGATEPFSLEPKRSPNRQEYTSIA